MSVGRGWGSPFCSEGPGAVAVAVHEGMSVGVSLGGLSVLLHAGAPATVFASEEG